MTTTLRSAHTHLKYKDWIKRVDAIVQSKLGLSIDDLPDCCTVDWHANDMSPARAAARAIRLAKDY
jgi:hypothetical protein